MNSKDTGQNKGAYIPLEEEESLSQQGSSSNVRSYQPNQQTQQQQQKGELSKSIGIIVENVAGNSPINIEIPPLALDPPPVPPPIQAVQLKAMKSRAVEQIQTVLQKRRKQNRDDWKENMLFVTIILSALAGLLFTAVGVLLQIKFTDRILWSIPAYLWLYLVAVYIFSIILTGPLASVLVGMWRFSFFYENYVYYYTHGIVRGLHILLAAAIPWLYWTYFASQSEDVAGKTAFEQNTKWVPRIYLSFIVVGTCLIGKQILVRVLAGSIQAINYREHVRSVLFLEKVLNYLSGKYTSDKMLTVTHADLVTSIKNVEKGGSALHPKIKKESSFYQKLFSQFYLKGVGIKTPTLRSKRSKRMKTPEELAEAAQHMANKIFNKLDINHNGYLTIEHFKSEIRIDKELAKSTFDIFDRDGDGFVTFHELSSVIEEVYIHRRSLQHSLKDTKNLEKSLEEVVTGIFLVIGFIGLLTVFGVDVQASIISFSVVFFSLGFALGPFLQQLIYCIVLIFFVKPYDVGDRISIGESSQILIIESIGLWMTDTLDGSGKRHYLHNGNLAKEHIVNHTRTSRVDLSLDLNLSLDVSAEVIHTIKDALTEWAKSDPELLQTPSVNVSNVSIDKNMVTVGLSCGLNCSWFDPRRGKARQEFIDLVYQLIRQLGIKYTPPTTTHLVKLEKETESKKDI